MFGNKPFYLGLFPFFILIPIRRFTMNNTALGAENKRNRQSILSAKHMKNSTMKNEKRYAIRMCTTRHFAIALASVLIREEISIASMILRRDV